MKPQYVKLIMQELYADVRVFAQIGAKFLLTHTVPRQ